MASRPKKWPHHATWARDGAAEAVQLALRKLTPLLDHSDIVVVATVGIAASQLQLALRNLESVGASTRPTDET